MHTKQLHTSVVLFQTFRGALVGNTVSIIACPVDCSGNIKLTDKLRESEFVVDSA
jgi:hypothetical protein